MATQVAPQQIIEPFQPTVKWKIETFHTNSEVNSVESGEWSKAGDSFTVGRKIFSTLGLGDSSSLGISRNHAQICYEPHGAKPIINVTDLSQGGLMLNKELVVKGQKYPLSNGDKISVLYHRATLQPEAGIIFYYTIEESEEEFPPNRKRSLDTTSTKPKEKKKRERKCLN